MKKQIKVTRVGYKTRYSRKYNYNNEGERSVVNAAIIELKDTGRLFKDDGDVAFIGSNFLKDAIIEVIDVTEQAAAAE